MKERKDLAPAIKRSFDILIGDARGFYYKIPDIHPIPEKVIPGQKKKFRFMPPKPFDAIAVHNAITIAIEYKAGDAKEWWTPTLSDHQKKWLKRMVDGGARAMIIYGTGELREKRVYAIDFSKLTTGSIFLPSALELVKMRVETPGDPGKKVTIYDIRPLFQNAV